jgi:hypothetical protein
MSKSYTASSLVSLHSGSGTALLAECPVGHRPDRPCGTPGCMLFRRRTGYTFGDGRSADELTAVAGPGASEDVCSGLCYFIA